MEPQCGEGTLIIFRHLGIYFSDISIIVQLSRWFLKVSEYDREIPQSQTADQTEVPHRLFVFVCLVLNDASTPVGHKRQTVLTKHDEDGKS